MTNLSGVVFPNNVGEIPDRINNIFRSTEMSDVSVNDHPFLNRK